MVSCSILCWVSMLIFDIKSHFCFYFWFDCTSLLHLLIICYFSSLSCFYKIASFEIFDVLCRSSLIVLMSGCWLFFRICFRSYFQRRGSFLYSSFWNRGCCCFISFFNKFLASTLLYIAFSRSSYWSWNFFSANNKSLSNSLYLWTACSFCWIIVSSTSLFAWWDICFSSSLHLSDSFSFCSFSKRDCYFNKLQRWANLSSLFFSSSFYNYISVFLLESSCICSLC